MRSFFIPALTAVASLGIPGALASVTCDQGSGSDSKPLLDARELIDTTQECIQNLCATKEEGITTKQCGPLVVSVARLTALPSNAEECMIQLNSIINECISTESTSGGFSGTKDALYDISFPDQEDDERDDPYRGLWTGGHVPDGEPDSDVEDGEDGFEVDLNTVKDSETRRHRIKRQPGKSSPKTKKSGKSSSSKASSTKSKAAPKSTLKTTAKGSGKAAATQGSKKATSSAKITPSSSKKASTSAKPTSKSSKKAQSSAKATSNSSRKSTSSAKATVSSSPSSTSSDNAACTLTNQKDSKNNKGTGKNESSSGKGNTKNGRNLDRRGCGQSHQVEDDIPLEQPRRPVRPYQKKELDPNKVTWWSFNNMRQGTVDPAVQEIINGLGVKAQLDVVKISNAALSVRGRFGPDKTKLKRINPGYWTKRGDKYLVVNGGFYDPVKKLHRVHSPKD
ncbi:unnamed protein product [Periconia digitata]|uniref:Uncharacterized protein n=1 Tax=Periconia digitata TaxID=1303443 RepID=A0A9W4UD21_9PLEO|nr:unnamed protein product [Periconia digitata]